jgi:transposase
MMGPRQVAQGSLFYEFSIEDHVPPDHLLRFIDRFVDLGDMRRHLAPFYSSTGRPSVDPELMIRMLLVGYCFGIRSVRRLCEEVHLNLAYRWFCRLDLADPVPDHSTFSKNRHGRFRDSDLFRHLFEEVLTRCIAEGLVGGDSFGADASLIKADASRHTKVEFAEWTVPETVTRATREYLDTLDDAAFGAATPVQPKTLSPSDPAARFTNANRDRAFFAYSTNYLVDLKNAVIVDVRGDGTDPPGRGGRRTKHAGSHRRAVRPSPRTAGGGQRLRFGRHAWLAGWRTDRAAHPGHRQVRAQRRRVPCHRLHLRDEADEYRCPGGRALKPYWRDISKGRPEFGKDGFKRYFARREDCGPCLLKPLCTPNQATRKISRSRHESARQAAREIATTDAYVASSYARRKVEMLFAHLKRILRLDRLRLRGPNGARDEFLLAATAQNLRKLAKLIPSEPAPA